MGEEEEFYDIDLFIPGVKRAEVLDALRSIIADSAFEPSEGDDCCRILLSMDRFSFSKDGLDETVIEVELEGGEPDISEEEADARADIESAALASTTIDRAGNKVVENKGVK